MTQHNTEKLFGLIHPSGYWYKREGKLGFQTFDINDATLLTAAQIVELRARQKCYIYWRMVMLKAPTETKPVDSDRWLVATREQPRKYLQNINSQTTCSANNITLASTWDRRAAESLAAAMSRLGIITDNWCAIPYKTEIAKTETQQETPPDPSPATLKHLRSVFAKITKLTQRVAELEAKIGELETPIVRSKSTKTKKR